MGLVPLMGLPKVGIDPYFSAPYLTVGTDCVLYHAYWDGTAKDHSSHGNDGTTIGSPSFGLLGLILNGTTQYVNVPDSLSLRLNANVAQTIEIFFNPTDVTLDGGLAARSILGGTTTYYFFMSANNSAEFDDGSSGPYTLTDALTSGNWVGVAYTLAIDAGGLTFTFKGYTAGVPNEFVEQTPNLNLGVVTNVPTTIGFMHDSDYLDVDLFFKGTIGEIRIWNTVLSDAQILSNYNATKARYGL